MTKGSHFISGVPLEEKVNHLILSLIFFLKKIDYQLCCRMLNIIIVERRWRPIAPNLGYVDLISGPFMSSKGQLLSFESWWFCQVLHALWRLGSHAHSHGVKCTTEEIDSSATIIN